MADVWLAPYLPLNEDLVVSPWRLVPFEAFARRHCRSLEVFNEARRLRTAYKLRNTGGIPFGAVIFGDTARVGDDQPRELIRPMHHALVVGLLDANPSLLKGDSTSQAGHRMAAADNAVVFGHPLHGGRSYAIAEGAMVRRQSLRTAQPGQRLPRVAPPSSLPTPWGAVLDDEYASAVYDVLTRGDIRARRIDRSIEWLSLAWTNHTEISEDARVIVFRAGFEALLGGGAQTAKNRRLLSELLDEPDARRTPRMWPGGATPTAAMTDLEWWFQSFAFLRNKIAHGDAIPPADWLFEEGKRHLWHADDVLRRAIKRTVIRAGHDPLLEQAVVDRLFSRANEAAVRAVERPDQP